jgi:hypothetical protein
MVSESLAIRPQFRANKAFNFHGLRKTSSPGRAGTLIACPAHTTRLLFSEMTTPSNLLEPSSPDPDRTPSFPILKTTCGVVASWKQINGSLVANHVSDLTRRQDGTATHPSMLLELAAPSHKFHGVMRPSKPSEITDLRVQLP